MYRVFINYRTGDGEIGSALIEQMLSSRFGPDVIFRASSSIRPGDDFEKAILRAVRQSDALLALVGPRWLSATDEQGRPALEDPADWVRREILQAFEHDVRVIPVLIGSVRRLSADDLPAALGALAHRQYVRFDHRNVVADIEKLAAELVKVIPGLTDQTKQGAKPGATERSAPGSSTFILSDRVDVGGDLFGGSKYGDGR